MLGVLLHFSQVQFSSAFAYGPHLAVSGALWRSLVVTTGHLYFLPFAFGRLMGALYCSGELSVSRLNALMHLCITNLADHKLSKYETLQMAQTYIGALASLMERATAATEAPNQPGKGVLF